MTAKSWLAIALVAICNTAVAQAPSPMPGISGTGPGVTIQVGPNGTLDVGGAGAGNLDFTGGNLLGRFGASRPQPAMISPEPSPTFAAPAIAPGIGYPTLRPSIGLGLGGLAPLPPPVSGDIPANELGKLGASGDSESRLDAMRDLILPRFRWTTKNKPRSRPDVPRPPAASAGKDDEAF